MRVGPSDKPGGGNPGSLDARTRCRAARRGACEFAKDGTAMDKANNASRREKHTHEHQNQESPPTRMPNRPNGTPPNDPPLRAETRPAAETAPTATAEALIGDIGFAVGAGRLQDAFLDERDDVLNVINELEDQLDRYQDIRSALERQLAEANENLLAANQKLQELEWQCVTLQTRADTQDQVRQELTLLEEQVADANSRAARLAEHAQQLEKENARLQNELKTASKQVEELWTVRKERDGLRVDLRAMRARVDELERSQRESLEERGQIIGRLQETQIALDQTREIRLQLEADLHAATDRIHEFQQIQKSLEEKLEAVRGEKKAYQAQVTHLERENARLIEQRQFYESQLTTLRNANRQAEGALSSVKKAFAEVRIALSETRSRARRRTTDAWPRIGSILTDGKSGEEVLSAAELDADELGGPIKGFGSIDATAPAARATAAATSTDEDYDDASMD